MIFSSEFDGIQNARRFDDPSISQGEWVTEIKEADWQAVTRICQDLLANKTKDLRLVAWLTEAQCKQNGFSGLADGYELLGELCESAWEGMHPLPEDGDIEQRTGVLDWLAAQTARLIREIPLTHSKKGNFSLIDHESALIATKNIERNPAQTEEHGRDTVIDLDLFEVAAKDTPTAHFQALSREIERLQKNISSVSGNLDRKMGEYAPSFRSSQEALDDVRRFLQRYAGSSTVSATNDSKSAYPTSANIGNANERIEPTIGSTQEIMNGPIKSRDHAIRQLVEIANFFRQTEPHSPVAYLAEKAAKWGSMPLHEWLRTVVKDDGALLRVEELLGVDPPPPT
ncbi:MAG: type VI secretion system protein TssA [Azonexaceae bacterium]|nr:type VI secretion system protein TssA [Azonexaceae bacterium]